MTIHAKHYAAERREAAARQAAKEAERQAQYEHSQKVGAQKQAERDAQAAEAKAAADRAYAIEYAAMTPMQREVEDYYREVIARDAAAKAVAPTTTTDRPKPRHETMSVPIYDPPPPIDPTDVDGMEARAEALAARAEAEPSEANRYVALVAGAEAAKSRAMARFQTLQKRSDEDVAAAVRAAGDDPIARAREKARVLSNHAAACGQAEKDYLNAELAYDNTIVETAKASKLIAHRIESRKAAVKADAAKAENDPQSIGNPYYVPPRSLARWQFEALTPEMQAKASADGVRVYSDEPPAFTAADAASVLRSRGSANRNVLTRSELAELPPAEQAKAARTAIIVD